MERIQVKRAHTSFNVDCLYGIMCSEWIHFQVGCVLGIQTRALSRRMCTEHKGFQTYSCRHRYTVPLCSGIVQW